MNVYAEGTRVRVQLPKADVDEMHLLLAELDHATTVLKAEQADWGKADLRSFEEPVAAAEADYEDRFAQSLTIEEAETLYRRLFAAITAAKIKAGRFDYRSSDGD